MRLVILFFMVIFLTGCTTPIPPQIIPQGNIQIVDEPPTNEDTSEDNRLSFHYQLQNADFSLLKNLDVDVIVIDVDDTGFEEEEVMELAADKIVLSYLSIGEAEDYRDYWDDWEVGNPGFVDSQNPDWEGNYKVKYWDPAWQSIMLEKVAHIKTLGYSGVYLDIIDAYEYYDGPSARDDMVDFVKRIKSSSNFLVIPQNSPELYPFYKDSVDGIGKEDTWYDSDDVQESEETSNSLGIMKQALADGKFVLAIDYPSDTEKICDFYKQCNEQSFACTVSNRELDTNQPVVCT